jgi:hypothetical protein
MSDLKHISSANKERLMGLVRKTASLVNQGVAPTDALVKAASDGEYPAEYILRAAESYNGAAHLAHFKHASTDSRGNSFPLIDAQEAVRRVVDSVSLPFKVASDPLASAVELGSYLEDPNWNEDVVLQSKQASAPDFAQMQRQASMLDRSERLAVEQARSAHESALASLAKSVEAFRSKTSSVSRTRKAQWAREALERHGKEAADAVALATGISEEECVKLASSRLGVFSVGVEEVNSLGAIVGTLDHCRNLSLKVAQAEHDAYVNGIERQELLDQAAGVKRSGIKDMLAPEAASSAIQTAFPGHASSSDAIRKGVLESLMEPDFKDQLERIDKARLLHKLIKTDPIVAGRNPNDIEQAFQEIVSIAPEAAKHEPLLRSMLRRRLEAGQQIDDFSLNQMLTMEDRIRDQRKEYSVVPKLTGLDSAKESPR